MGSDAASFFHFWGFEVDKVDKVDNVLGYHYAHFTILLKLIFFTRT